MIELNVPQGEHEWVMGRVGIPTASASSPLLTAQGKPSGAGKGGGWTQGVRSLFHALIGERVNNAPKDEWEGTESMVRGTLLEPAAFGAYSFITDTEPRTTGLCYTDERRLWSCSPDGLIDEGDQEGPGGLELKCPDTDTHIGYLLDMGEGLIPSTYRYQVQFSLWVTGRSWWDFCSYCPGLPMVRVRVYPDPAWQESLAMRVSWLAAELAVAQAELMDMGVTFRWREQE